MVENAHDIIYSHDLQGNYTSMNKAGEQIIGYTHEEIIRMNFEQTIAPEYLERARRMISSMLADEKITTYDLEIVAKDGRRIAVEVNTSIILQGGAPVGVQGIARDITERRQLEEQLRQSQKMEAVGQLAGGLAHGFNNLLTIISVNAQLALAQLAPDAPIKQRLVEIEKAADRAATLTRQLLAFSSHQQLECKIINLNDAVQEIMKLLRRVIGDDVELSFNAASDLASVFADAAQVEQVLINLAINARDAMPQGGKLIIETRNVTLDRASLHAHPLDQPGRYARITVSDTGTGMNDETRAHIFEPFFTTKAVGKGSGLGLAMVYGIVKQLNGLIEVYSEVGQGTTFKIYLPVAEDSVSDETPQA
jgi:PAS domain S-box-containing protein